MVKNAFRLFKFLLYIALASKIFFDIRIFLNLQPRSEEFCQNIFHCTMFAWFHLFALSVNYMIHHFTALEFLMLCWRLSTSSGLLNSGVLLEAGLNSDEFAAIHLINYIAANFVNLLLASVKIHALVPQVTSQLILTIFRSLKANLAGYHQHSSFRSQKCSIRAGRQF